MAGGIFMWYKKLIISGILCTSIFIGGTTGVFAASSAYTVQSGDTYWKISQKLNIPLNSLLHANNAADDPTLYIGQKIIVPDYTLHTAVYGDTYWKLSQKYEVSFKDILDINGANDKSQLAVGQQVKIPLKTAGTVVPQQPAASEKPYITYTYYTVQKGDILWNLSLKFGIPFAELLKANNLTTSSYLTIGQILKVPVHNVPVKSTPGTQYGEALDWWTEAQYVIPIGADFEVVDFNTGKSFFARRTTGSNHADCETLTAEDTAKMKAIWGGSFSWKQRPVLIKYKGRKIAASMAGMPHAGNESAAADAWTSWRSDDWGAGPNYDYIKKNEMDGHFDIHFLNSTRHKDGMVDSTHQANIKLSSGLK
jgi:D-gamma-glutamyl-meso-diaminopimelic acid endopeptidase CwlS